MSFPGTGLTQRLNDAAWRAPDGIGVALDAMNAWGSTLADLDSDGVYERLDWEHSKRMPSCAMGMRDDPTGSLTPVVTGVFHWRAHRWVRARRGLHAPFFRHAWAAALRGALDDVPFTYDDEPLAPAGERDTLLRLAEAGVPLRDAAGWIAAAYTPELREEATRCARAVFASTTDPWTALTVP